MKITAVNGHRYLFATIIFLYVLLFEFVLPSNLVLPKPSELYLALVALIENYDLIYSILMTLSALVVGSLLSFLIMHLFSGGVVKSFTQLPALNKIFDAVKYIPLFFFPVIIAFWVGNTIWDEYLYAFIICGYFFKRSIADSVKSIKPEYVDSARSLDIPESKIYSEVIWNSILPNIFHKYFNHGLIIITLIFLYEYISGNYGVGNVYRDVLAYKDFSSIFALTIVIAVISFVVKYTIVKLSEKIINWE